MRQCYECTAHACAAQHSSTHVPRGTLVWAHLQTYASNTYALYEALYSMWIEDAVYAFPETKQDEYYNHIYTVYIAAEHAAELDVSC